jgi:NAD(P)-dependent dehydrogenase (short-subunit alcohol dehydrogenase family)
MGELDGKVAVVVGAGPGIGRACALALGGAGADVVVAARRRAPLVALAEEVAAATGRTAYPVTVDLGDVGSCRALVAATVDRFGGVDIVVNVATDSGGRASVDEADWDGWRRAFEINVLGTLEVSRSAARSMKERGGGAIVQISTFGTTATPPKQASYTATKLAMVQASRTMAKELGPDGIRVNVVTPGYTTGPPLDAMWAGIAARSGLTVEEVSTRAASTAALRTHVDPEDIAEAVLFLASPRGRRITGVELPVTAGQQ